MKVLIANKFFFRNGGSETVMFQEREGLERAGIEVIDFSMQDERNIPSPHVDHFVRNRSYKNDGKTASNLVSAIKILHSHEAASRFARLIDATRPDLIHCHNIYHQLTPSIIGVAKRRGLPVVLTLHDYKVVCPVYTRLRCSHICSECLEAGPWKVVQHRCAEGSLAKSAILLAEAWVQRMLGHYESVDRFIAPSAFMRDSVIQGRLTPERVEVIHNGIDCEKTPKAFEDDRYALYLGRLTPEKGIRTLLAAHAEISDRVELMVAGTGPLEQELRHTYPAARYLGHLSGDALQDRIRRASIVVVPSEWLENCPMSILEAMALGKAVVASDIGGIPELVTHGETGLLFKPGDIHGLQGHIMRLMETPMMRLAYGTAARRRAEREFSIEKHDRSVQRLYRNLLDSSRARTPSYDSRPVSTP